MKIKILSSIDEICHISTAWMELSNSIKSSGIFQYPLWHLAWWKSMGKNKTMKILTAESDGQVVGIFPLALYRTTMKDGMFKLLGFSGGTQADRNDMIVYPDYKKEVADLFENEIIKLLKNVDLIYLNSIPIESKLLELPLINRLNSAKIHNSLPYLSLSNTTYEQVEKSWGKSHRGDVRRQLRRLSEKGNIRLTRIDKRKRAIELVDMFLVTHSKRWGKKYNSLYASINDFYKELINLLWDKGIIHFTTLDSNDKPVSYHFGFLYQNRFYYYKPVYDPNYANYSPGKLHISKLIEDGIKHRWDTFDFLLGNESYKYDWTNTEENSTSIYIKGEGMLSRFAIWWMTEGRKKLASHLKNK
jgi:CelD/BcsL family acetyltransferase involved in cellulose biosynthesis